MAATVTPSLLVSASSDATLKLWRNAEVEKTCLGHEGPVYSVAFSRDGSNFISASADKTARIWSVDGMSLAILRHRDEVRAACFGTRRSVARLQLVRSCEHVKAIAMVTTCSCVGFWTFVRTKLKRRHTQKNIIQYDTQSIYSQYSVKREILTSTKNRYCQFQHYQKSPTIDFVDIH